MASIETKIPAFLYWKVLNDTMIVPDVLKKEETVTKLVSIIKSSASENSVFVYEKDPALSYEEYQEIVSMYKSFTAWILGRFFYAMSSEKLYKIHEILIDIQKYILVLCSKTQPNVYRDLTLEYGKALNDLTDFYSQEKNVDKLVLEIFKPSQHEKLKDKIDLLPIFAEITSKNACAALLNNLTKIFQFIIPNCFTYCCFDDQIVKILQKYLSLLHYSTVTMKCNILELYGKIVNQLKLHKEFDKNIENILQQYFLYFESFLCAVNNKNMEVQLSHFESLEAVLNDIYDNIDYMRDSHMKSRRLTKLIYETSLRKSSIYVPSDKLMMKIIPYIEKIEMNFETAEMENFFIENILSYSFHKFCIMKNQLKEDILNHCLKLRNSKEIKVFTPEVSRMWYIFCDIFSRDSEQSNAMKKYFEFFNKLTIMLFEITVEVRNHLVKNSAWIDVSLVFFEEGPLFLNTIKRLNDHLESPFEPDLQYLYSRFFTELMLLANSKNLDIIFTLLVYPFLIPDIYGDVKDLPSHLIGYNDSFEFKKTIQALYCTMRNKELTKIQAITSLKYFFEVLSCGLLQNLNEHHIDNIQVTFLKVCRKIMKTTNVEEQLEILQMIPHILPIFSKRELYLNDILMPQIYEGSTLKLQSAISLCNQLICTCFSDYIKVIESKDMKTLTVTIYCEKCDLGIRNLNEKTNKLTEFVEERSAKKYSTMLNFCRNKFQFSSASNDILKKCLTILSTGEIAVKILALKVLPSLANHCESFHSLDAAKLWVENMKDDSSEVRAEFGRVVLLILGNIQANARLSEDEKKRYLDLVLEKLLEFTKQSLKHSEFELQSTLLLTIQSLIDLKLECMILPLFKTILYFVMVPTSKYSLIGISRLYYLAETHQKTPLQIYVCHNKEICETIVHLCAVNQIAVNSSLRSSLNAVSLILGFSVAEYITKEQFLLPFLVVEIKKIAQIEKLIEQMAVIVDIELPELLASKYGYIFIHTFLNQGTSGVYKTVMTYLEKTTGLSGENLRRKNFRVILNNLLLHFHQKNREVVLALHLLIKEDQDQERRGMDIPDYLQLYFLGVLQFFLTTLKAEQKNSEEILESLSHIFSFMGSKHITPLRFQIISMLQTVGYRKYPSLVTAVWFTFLKCCDLEMLGPQLATIFKSLQPLIEICPNEINKIYGFLIRENENKLSDNIKDLFFMKSVNICPLVMHILQTHLATVENYDFKQKIKWLLKYLTHETIEIRVEAMKELNLLMVQNREELDEMILGYNGIDPIVVELIDILTSTCREKDKQLKMACAEVIGELGAVEPSHLPRRYTHDTRAFPFFIYEDSFIVNALNELTKALQAEKDAVNMDRTALAIQEILKTYAISPDKTSSKYSIWKQFSEAQQELMMPLLCSRYISALNPCNSEYNGPIYGSPSGSTFQSWLFNWTCSLISKLPTDRRVLLEGCLPSMKQGERILMHFLPHILLHALIEGDSQEAAYDEFQAVLSSLNDTSGIDTSIPGIAALFASSSNGNPQVVIQKEFWRNQCTKIVFILLDFLDRWLREWQCLKRLGGRNDPNYKKVKTYLNRFCKLQLAKANYQCGEYPRALMYLEDFIMENPVEVPDNLSFLAEIYAQLDEPDGVAGAMALRQTEPSIEDRILILEVSGKLADAAACYERIKSPLKLRHLQGLVQCYLDLDNVNTALNFAYGAMSTQEDYGDVLMAMQAEPLWRLGRIDILEELLDKPEMKNNKSWGVQIGKALLHFDKGERAEFRNTLDFMKLQQVDSLGAASLKEGAYQHGYSYIARLHSLNELQQVEKCINELLVRSNDNKLVENTINKLRNEWKLRIKVVQESVRIVEPILCLRRVALERGKKLLENRTNVIPYINELLGECWLLSAKTARSARVHQQAYTYTLKAEEFVPPDLFIEKAALHWLREENEQAMTTLQRGLAVLLPNPSNQSLDALTLEQRKLCAEARLLIATYNDSTSNVEAEITLQNYKDAYEAYKGWEKSLVCLGQYYDRRFQSFSEEEKDSKASDIQIIMIKYFGHSLLYGSTYVYQSLPRLLSIWFDYGTRLLDVTQSKIREDRRSNLLKMTHLIDNCLAKLPVYIFLTAFSQLVSRICHPQREVYIELKSIIIKLLLHYPQQTLWMMIPIIKSSYAMRAKRCSEIFNDSKIKKSSIAPLLNDFTALAEKLIELCNKEMPGDVSTASVHSLLKSLPRMLKRSDFSEIMIPTHKFRKLVLPNPDFKNSEQHNPFPNQYVHIVGIDDEMAILTSLQRPRKITLRGSDGKGYIQMLKPKDDLRKDFRLMEFNDIVNQLLTREAAAREKRLNIRLYSVAPLNEECGLIEWVPNLLGLRPILMNLYNQNGLGMRNSELREAVCDLKDPLAKKRDVFLKKLLIRHPPILGEWFRKNFPDAQTWLTARTAFIRTTAVMSIVGYILGLGDRHGENISLDSISGDTVHVDFNCLFNKGETLEYPERVPFRLTHNMVSAMGPLGVEGMFRKSCVCTLGVLRTNTSTLMSIVTPFVYDPLVSWPRLQVHAGGAERTNEQAVEHIKNIELRLQGVIKTRGRIKSLSPLSIEGQTNYLIKEAMSIENLCQMYYGWGAYL